MSEEKGKWPYQFPMSPDFNPPNQRATISGELIVQGKYSPSSQGEGGKAYVGLAAPGPASSWQTDNKVSYTFNFFLEALESILKLE